ncbi:MAG: energy transducer TonB [Bacteroidales bacterium]|nr:energy transducer TonB [Deltaproteobacteria bacterium]MBL7138031.1 energy transducer TonB [Bacteroidales bacterium]
MHTGIRTESLTELVFQHRNREYGSYQLQRGYLKTLLLSAGIGIFLILLIVVIPFLVYLIRDFQLDLEMEYIYEVEYIPFAPPEDLLLVEMAKAHSTPPEEKQLVPVIAHTLTPEEEQKPVDEKADKQEDKPEDSDSASYGTRGEEIGRQANTGTDVATTIDVYPRYPGGEEARLYYLRRHVSYPKEAVDKGIQGVVMVLFVVEADGKITNVKVLQGIGEGCDEEAVRVTREMPKWSPGKRSGRPVRVMVKMPIVFGIPKK